MARWRATTSPGASPRAHSPAGSALLCGLARGPRGGGAGVHQGPSAADAPTARARQDRQEKAAQRRAAAGSGRRRTPRGGRLGARPTLSTISLPKFEVVVPEKEKDVRPDITRRARDPPRHLCAAGRLIQEFRRRRPGARQLALQGVESKVQKVSVDNDTWHRIRIGPISKLDRAQPAAHRSCARRTSTCW